MSKNKNTKDYHIIINKCLINNFYKTKTCPCMKIGNCDICTKINQCICNDVNIHII
jgi:hypothetical protein